MANAMPAIDELKSKLRDARRQYDMISSRDRIMLNVMALFLLVVVGYFLVLKPSLDSVSQAQATLKVKQELLQWMKNNESLAKSATQSKGSASVRKPGQSLLALINQTSGRFQVSLKRYEPDGNDKLRVWVEDVSFNGLIRWLNTLQTRHNVSVINISIDSQKEEGIVNAKVVFKG